MAFWVVLGSEYDGVRKSADAARAAVSNSRRKGASMVGPYETRVRAKAAFTALRGKGAVVKPRIMITRASALDLSPESLPTREGDPSAVAWVDGSAHDGAGVSAWGGVLVVPGAEPVPFMGRTEGLPGCGTSFDAECRACLAGIEAARLSGISEVTVKTDLDEIVIGRLSDPATPPGSGIFAILASQVRSNAGGTIRVRLEHVKSHSGEPGNELADALASISRLGGTVADVWDPKLLAST